MKKKPYISILIPCYNEENYIKQCLDSLIDDFVLQNAEILVLDGMSTDRTRFVVERYIKNHKNISIKLLDNPKKYQSYGLNSAMGSARGEVIVRADAHTKYPKDYVKKCVELLVNIDAEGIGGVMTAKGKTRFQKLVALAMKHPVGVGDAKFHLGNYSGYVDTVYLGTFWKGIFNKLGGFDPHTHPNEDAEFNLRILESGGKIYLDKSIKVEYFPRDSLKKLTKQYFNYGKGRSRTTLKHRRFTSPRQLAPIALVLGILASLILSVVISPVFLFFPASYVSSILIVSLLSFFKGEMRKFADVFLLSVIFMSMHISWGLGFLAKLFRLAE